MQAYYQDNMKNKYSLGALGILSGFLCFFGFQENGYKKSVENMLKRSDFDALRSDWNTVGKDFSKVIERENLPCDAD